MYLSWAVSSLGIGIDQVLGAKSDRQLSVYMVHFDSHRTRFREILYWEIFTKIRRRISIGVKTGQKWQTLLWRTPYNYPGGGRDFPHLPRPALRPTQPPRDLLWDGRSGDRIQVGARFSAPVQIGPGAHTASCTMGTGSFPGVKRPGRGVDHPPPSSAEVKERVELYLYSPSGPS